MSESNTVMCTYRVRASETRTCCSNCSGATGRRCTNSASRPDDPARVYRGADEQDRPFVVEIFDWTSPEATARAHEHPEDRRDLGEARHALRGDATAGPTWSSRTWCASRRERGEREPRPARTRRRSRAVFAALAHPMRRRILVCRCTRAATASAPATSPEALRAAAGRRRPGTSPCCATRGSSEVEAEGRERWYRLDRDRLQNVAGAWLTHFEAP